MSPALPAAVRRRSRQLLAMFPGMILVVACSGGPGSSPSPTQPSASPATSPAATSSPASSAPSIEPLASPTGTITLYTSVTQNTVDAVVGGWKAAHPGVEVAVFRAPTAEVAARIATDLQSGGLKADALWLSDPLSMAGYADQGLLQAWTPPSAGAIDAAYRTDTSFGTRLLNMVMIRGADVTPGPADWKDLLAPDVKGAIGIPDPGFAGSAFAALAYFSQADGYGTAFYQALKDNAATQVKAPDDVTSGVAEGRFKVGMTLDNSARTAIKKGSPIALAWPSSGAIAIYSPIAAVDASANRATADSFVDFTLSPAGQTAIAGTGWQPVVGSGGPTPEGSQVSPDWSAAFGKQKELLDAYRAIFGG
ncbi:MAG: extracellular solute-binding protein [Chloroflexi bacterium]|nr:extracellular solute-binding protein [Chloroflexota bacterium]